MAKRDDYDRSGKWLIPHQGKALLRLGGVQALAVRAVQAEVVQPRQLPDGLLEAQLVDNGPFELFLVELATYPQRRVTEQVRRGAMLVYLERGQLPEVLTVVLCPKGQYRVPGQDDLSSPRGWTGLRLNWRVVDLWTLPADQLLAANDVGLVPWVPLTQFEQPPAVILQECRRRIDEQAAPEEHENLLAVTQVLMGLRYKASGGTKLTAQGLPPRSPAFTTEVRGSQTLLLCDTAHPVRQPFPLADRVLFHMKNTPVRQVEGGRELTDTAGAGGRGRLP